MVWAGTSWFACPEWGSAYLHPVKPLSDLIEKDPNTSDDQSVAETKGEPITEQQVAERLIELKNEAQLLFLEKQELAKAKEEKLFDMACLVRDARS